MENVSKIKKAGQILTLKCPNCGKTSVFHKTKYPLLGIPQMKEVCENCGYRFDREPGFFLGAMYVSYGLAAIEGLIAFLLARQLIYGLSGINLAMVTIAAILLCAMWNYRLARVIWMNLYPQS